MNEVQFKIFSDFRNDFKAYCFNLAKDYGNALVPLQKKASEKDTPSYQLENPVVYNTALDELSQADEIKLIVIGDNPGKDEQLSKNQKYLVGQSGKIAAGFFKNHAEFNVDFRKNAVILNKTPVHTAKTKHLKYLLQNGDEKIRELIQKSQVYMAQKTAALHIDLLRAAEKESERPLIFLVGYGELKDRGIFTDYRNTLKECYKNAAGGLVEGWNDVFVFQHFSMNRFSIDLRDFMKENPSLSIVEAAHLLGTKHREEIFGNAF